MSDTGSPPSAGIFLFVTYRDKSQILGERADTEDDR
jgi:hypothetical protein